MCTTGDPWAADKGQRGDFRITTGIRRRDLCCRRMLLNPYGHQSPPTAHGSPRRAVARRSCHNVIRVHTLELQRCNPTVVNPSTVQLNTKGKS